MNFVDKKAFFVGGLLFASLVGFSPTSAVTQLSSNGSLNFSVTVPESISISLPSTAPTIAFTDIAKTGSFGYSSYGVTVGTNVARRYTLSMYSFNTSTTTSDLVSGTHALPTLSAAQTVSDLSTGAGWTSLNRWGYALGTTSDSSWTFRGVSGDSSNATIIHNLDDSVAQVTNGITTNIILGTKVDLNQAFGDYTTNLNFIVVAEPPKFDGIETMQEMTPSICLNATIGDSAQLLDSRDSKQYWITKLADGNCWMTQNLDFVISTSGTTLTTSDSDVTSNKTLTATNSWTYTDVSFYEGGDNYLPNGTGSATSTSELSSNSTNWHYHVGNYYNWPAATAGSGTSSVTDADATESICPKGWRLPTGGSYTNNYSFGKLTNAYGITNNAYGSNDTALLSNPLWFVRAGFVRDGVLYNQNSDGIFRSGWASSYSSLAGVLSFASSYAYPTEIASRDRGYSVRCVARGPIQNISEVTTMQQFGSLSSSEKTAVMNSMTTGVQYQLRDTRDNKLYWVSKLADGNVWMTQNLDLDLTTAGLSSEDSDIGYSNGSYPSTTVYWNSDSTYAPQITETTTSSSNVDTDTRSWDLGDYVYDGTTDSSCGIYVTSYADCTSYGFFSASGLAADSTARHYHVGNLYQWNTATAGSGGTITSGQAADSICPKGWRLPTSSLYGEFQALTTAYSADSTVQNLLNTPLYFVRGGDVNSGTLNYAGLCGYYWSSRPISDPSRAYFLRFFGTSYVYPSDDYPRYYGFNVRCVAR